MSMPQQKPGRSRQDWATPPEFIDAVKRRLQNDFAFDLAASDENVVDGIPFYTEADNALTKDWAGIMPVMYENGTSSPWLWCNPPYGDLRPWVEKAAMESAQGAHIAMLVPASVGANWWREVVVDNAYIIYLNGRLTFVGADAPYPRDLALLLFTPFIRRGSDTWTWNQK